MPAGAPHILLAWQWKGLTAVEGRKVIAGKCRLADLQHCAMKAHGGGFFEGEADGLGGARKTARTLFDCSVTVAAEIKLGASVKVWKCHYCL